MNTVKKILIVAYSMEIGGVEKALSSLLNRFDQDHFDITLRLIRKKGPLLKHIPKNVKVDIIEGYNKHWRELNDPPKKILKGIIKRNDLFEAIEFAYCWFSCKLKGNRHGFFKKYLKKEIESPHYDVAISYAGPSEMLDYYVGKKINATKKIAWIHFDVDKIGVNWKSHKEIYKNFDKIFIVSEEGKAKFIQHMPDLDYKVDVFHNLIDTQHIQSISTDYEPELKDGVNIVTVGRLSFEKGQDIALQALKILRETYKIPCNWIFIGDGRTLGSLEVLANKLGINEYVDFVGATLNPYPYMRASDVYVQTSRHEGYCITLAEAIALNCNIVSTNFTGAKEQLDLYASGIVCDPSPEALAKAISEAINIHNSGSIPKAVTALDDFRLLEDFIQK